MVASNNWGAVVKKGTIIVMSMILKKVELDGEWASRQRKVCPRCYETHVGVMQDYGWLRWYVINIFLPIRIICDFRFHIMTPPL